MKKSLERRGVILTDEQILQSLLHSFVIPAFIIGLDHRVIHWNRALEAITGVPASRVIHTRQHWRVFYPSKRPCLADLLVDGKIDNITKWYGPGGKMSDLIEDAYEAVGFFATLGETGKWLRVTASTLREPSGQVIGAAETLEDITEHKRIDEERERLVIELQNALSKIKTLKGLLPICSACKKIRNDKGYWEQIENFIHEHSDAEFSHGICPECAQKLYPNYYPSKK